jgi:hypothetical protein
MPSIFFFQVIEKIKANCDLDDEDGAIYFADGQTMETLLKVIFGLFTTVSSNPFNDSLVEDLVHQAQDTLRKTTDEAQREKIIFDLYSTLKDMNHEATALQVLSLSLSHSLSPFPLFENHFMPSIFFFQVIEKIKASCDLDDEDGAIYFADGQTMETLLKVISELFVSPVLEKIFTVQAELRLVAASDPQVKEVSQVFQCLRLYSFLKESNDPFARQLTGSLEGYGSFSKEKLLFAPGQSLDKLVEVILAIRVDIEDSIPVDLPSAILKLVAGHLSVQNNFLNSDLASFAAKRFKDDLRNLGEGSQTPLKIIEKFFDERCRLKGSQFDDDARDREALNQYVGALKNLLFQNIISYQDVRVISKLIKSLKASQGDDKKMHSWRYFSDEAGKGVLGRKMKVVPKPSEMVEYLESLLPHSCYSCSNSSHSSHSSLPNTFVRLVLDHIKRMLMAHSGSREAVLHSFLDDLRRNLEDVELMYFILHGDVIARRAISDKR